MVYVRIKTGIGKIAYKIYAKICLVILFKKESIRKVPVKNN